MVVDKGERRLRVRIQIRLWNGQTLENDPSVRQMASDIRGGQENLLRQRKGQSSGQDAGEGAFAEAPWAMRFHAVRDGGGHCNRAEKRKGREESPALFDEPRRGFVL